MSVRATLLRCRTTFVLALGISVVIYGGAVTFRGVAGFDADLGKVIEAAHASIRDLGGVSQNSAASVDKSGSVTVESDGRRIAAADFEPVEAPPRWSSQAVPIRRVRLMPPSAM
jgi:hypothetical protein